MKTSLLVIVISFFCYTLNAQSNEIDKLIDNLNNNQLRGTCHYAWVLEINSKSADSLMTIGKSATSKLLPWLDDSNKGLIVHCILSHIWIEDFSIGSSFEKFNDEGIVEYTYNELYFYEKDSKMIIDKNALETNKKKWIKKFSN